MIDLVRAGDSAAFAELYERHVAAAERLARTMMFDRAEADDVVSEVFAATFAAIQRGRGPRDELGSYLRSSVRRECRRSWRRGARQRPVGPVVAELTACLPDEFAATDEHDVLLSALDALPDHLRTVLWQSEVAGLSHAEIAARNGSTPAAVAQLAQRARRAFAERYLHLHLASSADVAASCTVVRSTLAEVVRGTAPPGRRASVQQHVAECADCRRDQDELTLVNARLRSVGPLAALSVSATADRFGLLGRFLAWAFGPSTALSAAAGAAIIVAAMPLAPPVIPDGAAPPAVTAPAPARVPREVVPTLTEPLAGDGVRAPAPPVAAAAPLAAPRPAPMLEPAAPIAPAPPAPAAVPETVVLPAPSPQPPPVAPSGPALGAVEGPLTSVAPILTAMLPDVEVEVEVALPRPDVPILGELPVIHGGGDLVTLNADIDTGVADLNVVDVVEVSVIVSDLFGG